MHRPHGRQHDADWFRQDVGEYDAGWFWSHGPKHDHVLELLIAMFRNTLLLIMTLAILFFAVASILTMLKEAAIAQKCADIGFPRSISAFGSEGYCASSLNQIEIVIPYKKAKKIAERYGPPGIPPNSQELPGQFETNYRRHIPWKTYYKSY